VAAPGPEVPSAFSQLLSRKIRKLNLGADPLSGAPRGQRQIIVANAVAELRTQGITSRQIALAMKKLTKANTLIYYAYQIKGRVAPFDQAN